MTILELKSTGTSVSATPGFSQVSGASQWNRAVLTAFLALWSRTGENSAIRNFRGGGGNEVHGLMTFCHNTRKGRNIESHWPMLWTGKNAISWAETRFFEVPSVQRLRRITKVTFLPVQSISPRTQRRRRQDRPVGWHIPRHDSQTIPRTGQIKRRPSVLGAFSASSRPRFTAQNVSQTQVAKSPNADPIRLIIAWNHNCACEHAMGFAYPTSFTPKTDDLGYRLTKL